MSTPKEAKAISKALQNAEATMRGRKPIGEAVVDLHDESINQQAVAGAMVHMREQGMAQREQEDAQLAMAAQAVGGALMARLHKSFSHAAEVNMFNQVRDLPLAVLRRIPLPKIPDASGSFEAAVEGDAEKVPDTSGNLEDFCRRVFGRSYNTMLEEAQNLHLLGAQAYEISTQLRISKSALRLTRALPPEKLDIVRSAIADGSTRAEVLAVIEDLAEKVQQAEAATQEEKAEHEATRTVLEKKTQRIDQLERGRALIAKLPADDQLAMLKKEATAIAQDAEGAVLGGLRQALLALRKHADANGTDAGQCDVFMVGLVGQVQAQISALREEFNLPDVSSAAQAELAAEVAQWAQ